MMKGIEETKELEEVTSAVRKRQIKAWLTDMDGVLVHENQALPGAQKFLDTLQSQNLPYLVLTNNSIFTNRDLSARLERSGLHVPEENIWTSANATAAFLTQQSPNSTAYVIGEAGLTTAIHNAGYIMTDTDPEYVVLGETRSYDFQTLTKAIRLIESGAKFIATNPDVTGPSNEGILPTTGSVAAMITKATGRKPYFVGKPNPVMLRAGLNKIRAHSEHTAMIGDRMDTDMQAAIEAGLYSYLVLSGSTTLEDVKNFPFRPAEIYQSIEELVEHTLTPQTNPKTKETAKISERTDEETDEKIDGKMSEKENEKTKTKRVKSGQDSR